MELASELYPDDEQDLGLGELGMEDSRFKQRFERSWGGTGDDEGVGMVASRVGGLVITDSTRWQRPGIEELLSTTLLSNLK